jgi:cytoskeletal protein CcmA (bactofilin family)
MTDAGAEYPTTIGADASFKGQLNFEKGARLLGKFEGEITTKGQILIAEGAEFSGEARSGDIRVEGKVNGNLHAGGRVQLTASSRLEGDVQAGRLEVAEGAVLVGRVSIGAKGDGQAGVVKQAAAAVATAPAATPEPDAKAKDKQPVTAGGKK